MGDGRNIKQYAVIWNTGMTRHALTRLQQRSVPALVMSLLLDYGSLMRHGGAEVVFLDKEARCRFAKLLAANAVSQ
jgi:hypothetical protein